MSPKSPPGELAALKRPLDEPRKKFLADLAHELFHRLLSLPEDKAAAVLGVAGSICAAANGA